MDTSLRARLRRRLTTDDGFSLVEVLVAMFVLMVVMSALLAALGTSIKTVQLSDARGAASQLGSERLEQLQAVAFTDELGFYAADPSYRPTWDGAQTVALSGSRPTACPTIVLAATAPEPVPPCPLVRRVVDGTQYTVRTDITLTDATASPIPSPSPSPSASPAYYYKQLRVQVEWNGNDGASKQTVLGALRAPTPSELAIPAASPVTPTSTTSPTASPTPSPSPSGPTAGDLRVIPTSQVLTSGGATSEEMLVTLTVGTAPTSIAGGWRNGARSGTLLWTPNTARTTWTSRISLGTAMTAGTVDVTADATYGGTVIAHVTTATVSDAAAPPVDVQTPVVTPSLCRGNHSNSKFRTLHRDTVVSVEILGVAPTDTVKLGWTAPNVSGLTMVHQRAGAAGGHVFAATIPAGTEMHEQSTTLTVSAQRASDPQPATETFPVTVHVAVGTSACPA